MKNVRSQNSAGAARAGLLAAGTLTAVLAFRAAGQSPPPASPPTQGAAPLMRAAAPAARLKPLFKPLPLWDGKTELLPLKGAAPPAR